MADTHEEQLLSDLLANIAREDAALDARHLEARVLESVATFVDTRPRRSKAWMLLPAAATVIIGVAVSVVGVKPDTGEVRIQPKATTEVELKRETTSEVRLKADTTRAGLKPRATTEVRLKPDTTKEVPDATKEGPATRQEAQLKLGTTTDGAPMAPAAVRTAEAPIEFVPLLPLAEGELAGPFQIVRVQMPSASLGALRPPLVQPNEIVEADVLLGEDGRARAIRVNTNGSIYPWRSR